MNQPLRILLVDSRPGGTPESATNLLEELRRRFPGFEVTIVADPADLARGARTETEERYLSAGRIARGVAHDLNNLLTVVFGYTALAKTRLPGGDPAIKSLETVEQAARQANVATRALLGFGAQSPSDKIPLDLRAAAAEASQILERSLPASTEFARNESGPPVWVEADRSQILPAIVSLGLIARDALPPNGSLRLSIRVDGSPDDGVVLGIFASVEAPSCAASPSPPGPAPSMPGTSTERRIVEQHGGRLEISRPDSNNLAIRVVLPAARRELESSRAPSVAGIGGQGELILLADPYDYLREIAACALRSAGYEVLAAKDGPGLLDLFSKNKSRVSLIVLESDLPAKTGLECLRDIRAGGCDAPAIVINGSPGHRQAARRDPQTACLQKPFQTSDLLELASSLIRRASRSPEP